ncbi:Ltp family lipoprotein [Enterococcus cecorum]|uniref:Ltp family lipoprotein n=1 Tax=Enterococcus cecorum TaxID=44008 RepID=UPI0032C4AF74
MKEKKPIYKRWWFIAIVVVFVIGVFGNLGGGKKTEVKDDETTEVSSSDETEIEETVVSEEEIEESEPVVETKTEESKPAEPAVPIEYKNALRKAKQYSEMMHMSKQAIYDQLTSEYGEQFPAEAAQYAVDNLIADYNANALEKAKKYRDTMAMSNDAIYDQLTSDYGEQFTPEEAQYAVDNLN